MFLSRFDSPIFHKILHLYMVARVSCAVCCPPNGTSPKPGEAGRTGATFLLFMMGRWRLGRSLCHTGNSWLSNGNRTESGPPGSLGLFLLYMCPLGNAPNLCSLPFLQWYFLQS